MTYKALAEALGISTRALYQFRKEGIPTDNVEKAAKWLAKRESGKVEGRVAGTPDKGAEARQEYWLERAAREALLRKKAELDLAEQEGSLVTVETAAEIIVAALGPISRSLDNMPQNLAYEINPRNQNQARKVLRKWVEDTKSDVQAALTKWEQNHE